MAKYEIMMIIDPKEDFKSVETLIEGVFSKKPTIKKMDKTELAYEINKSKTAHYALINVNANGDEVKELTRKVNISKTIWRILAINLDTEMGRDEALPKIAARKKKLEEEWTQRQALREERMKQYQKSRETESKKEEVK